MTTVLMNGFVCFLLYLIINDFISYYNSKIRKSNETLEKANRKLEVEFNSWVKKEMNNE